VTDQLNLHLSTDLLERYAMNRLTESRTAHVEEHLLLCRSCCTTLTAIDEEIKMIQLVLGGSEVPAQSRRAV
jgi:hypothetical protein